MTEDEYAHSKTLPASLPPEDVLEMLAHELKHPTHSIIGWTHILAMDGISIEEKSKAIDRIQICSEELKRCLDEILAYLARRKTIDDHSVIE
jgi:signal transduction histidine kinase